MSDNRIPVFDDFGNLVGHFIPEGGGSEIAIIGLLVMLILLPVGFILYLVYRIIVFSINEALRGRWGLAVIVFTVLIASVVFAGSEIIRFKAETAADLALMSTNPAKVTSITKIQDGMSCEDVSGTWVDCESGVYNKYLLTNNLKRLGIKVGGNSSPYVIDNKWGCSVSNDGVQPGETLTFMCTVKVGEKLIRPCFPIWQLEQTPYTIGKWCIDSNTETFVK